MGRQRGKGAVSGGNVSTGNEPDYPEFIRKCFEEDLQDKDQQEFSFAEELIIEKYCEKLRKSFPKTNADDLKGIAVQSGSSWFELLKKDLDGGRNWSDESLQTALDEKMAQLLSGKPFIRKPLFIYWALKIEYSDKFRESLKQICTENLSSEARNAKFQELSDEFFKNHDFDKMSVDELQWYCDTHHSELDITERPCFLNDESVGIPRSIAQPDKFMTEVLEKAVDYGVECRMKELDISHLEGLKKELDLVQSRLSGVVARMSALKADYGQREKVLTSLKKDIIEKDEQIEFMRKQILRNSKKNLEDYVWLSEDRLTLKCLELAGDVGSIDALAERVLRKENYDENVVLLKRDELIERIDSHLNCAEDPVTWNRQFLLKFIKKKFKDQVGTRGQTDSVDHLLKLKI